MPKHSSLFVLILFIVIASCSKKHENNTPPYVPHYPRGYIFLDSMPDIQIPKNKDTVITLQINPQIRGFMPTIVEVSIKTSAANISVSPTSASASTDTTIKLYKPMIFPFTLHINAVDTGVIPITALASGSSAYDGGSSSFKIIVR